jgi:hypothetical protein
MNERSRSDPAREEEEARPRHTDVTPGSGAPRHVADVIALQRTAGNRATAAMIMRENGDGDGTTGTTTTPKTRKDTLDAEIIGLLQRKITEVGDPREGERQVAYAQRVIRAAKAENAAKVNEFKTNVVEKWVKEQAYTAGTFAKETRATYDPDAISNPALAAIEKREIADFLKKRNKGPTVRVDKAIVGSGWSILLHYDLLGPAHGTIHTPHVQFLKGETLKDKARYVGDHTRAMSYAETKQLMDAPDDNPAWAVTWAKQEAGIT